MKNIIITALAVGSLANVASADWDDYYSIGFAGPAGVITHAGPTTTALTPDAPLIQGTWNFTTSTPPGNGKGEFQRTPGLTSQGFATGFSLTVLGTTADPGGSLATFTIASPVGVVDPSLYCPQYSFSWNLLAKPGTTAWWVDSDGTHPIATTVGTGVFMNGATANPGDPVGFFIQGDTLNTLQVQGWDCVPEPSSIAMGLVTLLGAATVGYRRFRGQKA